MILSSLTQLEDKIDETKRLLIVKASRIGIWENFGQKEGRMLTDACSVLDYFESQKRITAFLEWAETYEEGGIK